MGGLLQQQPVHQTTWLCNSTCGLPVLPLLDKVHYCLLHTSLNTNGIRLYLASLTQVAEESRGF